MTVDDLERQILEIKKQGLPFIVEQSKISEIRGMFYDIYMEDELRSISLTFHRNIDLLGRIHKTLPSVNNVKEYVGATIPLGYEKFIKYRSLLTNMRYAAIVSMFYGVPMEILLFTDLSANEEITKTKYPFIFRKATR
jgi:hypothetical protein